MKKSMLNKLKELGYVKHQTDMYVKLKYDIVICFNASKIVDSYISIIRCIRNRNDIQDLHDRIENYDKQLKIMQKDLEILKGVK